MPPSADWDAPAPAVTVPAQSGSERRTNVRYLVLFSACVLAVITYLLRVGFSAVATDLRIDLGLGQNHLGYFSTAFMIAYGLFEVPWGLMGDRFGVRTPLVLVALGGSLTTAAVALVVFLPPGVAWALGALLVLRTLFGAMQAGTFPLMSRMMTDWMPTTERGSAQGFIWTSSRFGGSLAPLLLIPLFQSLGNWQWPLVIAAAAGLVWSALFWPWFRNRPEESPFVNEAERKHIASGRAAKPAGHHQTPWRRMLRSRSVWALCIMYGGLGYSGNFFLFWLPDYLRTQRGLDAGVVKWLAALPFVCGIVACVGGGALSDWLIRRTGNRLWARRLPGMAGLTLAAAAFLATITTQNVWLLGLLLCVTFFGNDLSMGPAWAAVADKGERHAGTLGGLMNMTASFTAAAAMVLTGLLFEAGYERLPFLIFCASYLVGALSWLWVDVTHTLAEPDHDAPAELAEPEP